MLPKPKPYTCESVSFGSRVEVQTSFGGRLHRIGIVTEYHQFRIGENALVTFDDGTSFWYDDKHLMCIGKN